MILSNTIKILSPYKGKSKFEFWHSLKTGDKVHIEIKLQPTGRGANGLRPTQVTAVCGEFTFTEGLNKFIKYLGQIQYGNVMKPDAESALVQIACMHEDDEISHAAMKVLKGVYNESYHYCLDCDGMVTTVEGCCMSPTTQQNLDDHEEMCCY